MKPKNLSKIFTGLTQACDYAGEIIYLEHCLQHMKNPVAAEAIKVILETESKAVIKMYADRLKQTTDTDR